MDPIGIGSRQLDLLNLSGSEGAPRLDQLAADLESGSRDRKALLEAAEQFEAVFLNQLMKAMRSTVPENKLFNSGGPTKFYQQMHDAELAGALASGPSRLGIAEMIVRQLEPPADQAGEPGAPLVPGGRNPLPERLGPPVPAALQRYRSLSSTSGSLAAAARLRARASAQGQAVADTFGRFEPQFGSAAAENGLDPALLLAVVMEESAGDPLAQSPKGAQGLMQLMPDTARELGVEDSRHPGQNLAGGARYLAQMLKRYDGDLPLALAAFNAGPGNVDRAGKAIPDFPETRRYVARVLERYEGLGGGTDLAKPD